MSSHMFEEVEHTCDKVALIKDGKIIAVKSTREVKHNEEKTYKIEFTSHEDYQRFLTEPFDCAEQRENQNQVIVNIHDRQINTLFKVLKEYEIKFITENKYTLEKYFRSLY